MLVTYWGWMDLPHCGFCLGDSLFCFQKIARLFSKQTSFRVWEPRTFKFYIGIIDVDSPTHIKKQRHQNRAPARKTPGHSPRGQSPSTYFPSISNDKSIKTHGLLLNQLFLLFWDVCVSCFSAPTFFCQSNGVSFPAPTLFGNRPLVPSMASNTTSWMANIYRGQKQN